MATQEYINPPNVHVPPDPHKYSHGIRFGNMLFMAGQVSIDPQGKIVGIGDPEAQFRECWKNIQAIVEAAGGTIENVVKVTYYVREISHIDYELPIRYSLFPEGHMPCTTLIGVKDLGLPELLMEVDAWAVLPD